MRKLISVLIGVFFYHHLVYAANLQQAGIASAHPLATEAGLNILSQGGNAFDAAITVTSVLAVVEPYGSGLGGGGFYLLHQADAKDGYKNTVVDAREIAPQKAHKDMYISPEGRALDKLSKLGPLAAGIPGEPAAIAYLAANYGKLPLTTTLAPAIQLAKQGFVIDEGYRKAILYRFRDLSLYPTSSLLLEQGKIPRKGFKLVQPALAKTLEEIAKSGHAGFYHGEQAKAMVDQVQKDGGIWTLEDLAHYKVQIRQPLVGEYHGLKIVTTPPPSAGGLTVLTALNILKQYEADPLSESDKIHLVVESLRRAFCDRVKYVGDPDFNHVPVSTLLSQSHIKLISKKLDLLKATPSQSLQCGVPSHGGDQTTHFSIMDQEGNRVGATLSINQYFGSGYIEPNTGILLNNEMDDFSVQIGSPNLYGLVGHSSNLITPHKRPVSSMAPTFIESNHGIAIIGTPGGSRIPSMLLLAILEAEKNDSLLLWSGKARYHHQYMPDVISYEAEALSVPVQNALRLRGHRLEPTLRDYGNMQIVYWDNKTNSMKAASDIRGYGKGKVIEFNEKNNKEP